MATMVKLLVVIILLTDPSLQPVADGLARQVRDSAGKTPVQVVVGKDALDALTAQGVSDADLTAGPGVGTALTARERGLAVVRLERLDRGRDGVVEARVWLAGRQESTVAIAGGKDGKPGDPGEGAARAVTAILLPWMGEATAPAAPPLARLAERGEWQALITAAAGVAQPDARTLYYQVLGLHRLGRADEAAAVLARLKQAFPTSVHTGAAEQLMAARTGTGERSGQEIEVNDLPAPDDGSNVLR
jgi:hypothetical protein